MKKFFLIFIGLILCGCSAKYQLTIDGDKISEKVNFSVIPSQFKEEEEGPGFSLYSKNSLDYLKTADIYAIQDSQKYIYEKEITEQDNLLYINLKYDFNKDQFQESRFINECFENKDIKITKQKISIHLTGKFMCLNDASDSMEFKIATNNKVEYANIDYGIFDSEYVWEINSSNASNVDIQIDLLTESKYPYYGVRILGVALIVVVVGVGFYIYYKVSNRKDINKI